jgi:hypothetical protein
MWERKGARGGQERRRKTWFSAPRHSWGVSAAHREDLVKTHHFFHGLIMPRVALVEVRLVERVLLVDKMSCFFAFASAAFMSKLGRSPRTRELSRIELPICARSPVISGSFPYFSEISEISSESRRRS